MCFCVTLETIYEIRSAWFFDALDTTGYMLSFQIVTGLVGGLRAGPSVKRP